MTVAYLDPQYRPYLADRDPPLVRRGACAAAADAAARHRPRSGGYAATRSLWRYRAALPLACAAPITMGEGCTPLLRRRLNGAEVLLKCEWVMPTGSFKDRGASVMLSLLPPAGRHRGAGGQLRQWRRGGVGLCRRRRAARHHHGAGLDQPGQDGADARPRGEVELIPGSRQDTADAAVARSASRVLRQPQLASVLPARHQDAGLRTLGGSRLPRPRQRHRAVRRRVERAGLRDRLFRTAAGRRRSTRCPASSPPSPPIARRSPPPSWPAPRRRCRPPIAPTIAEGTAIAAPIRLREVLGALRETRRRRGDADRRGNRRRHASSWRGTASTWSRPPPRCWRRSPSLLASGAITPDQTTVLVLTGSGLKATPRIAEVLGVSL